MWIDLKKHFAARQIEWYNSFMLFLWGSYVLLHPGLFHDPYYRGMTLFSPQELWGYAAALVGSTRAVALFINGKWGLTPAIRVATCFTSVFMWFWICVGLYLSSTDRASTIIYCGLMVCDIISAFRAASDAYEAEANRRLIKPSEASNVTSIRSY